MTYQPFRFGGIEFYVVQQGGWTPMPLAEDQVAVTRIPGSTINYVDYAGRGPTTWAPTIAASWAIWLALKALRGTRASLTVAEDLGGNVYPNSLLASLSNLRTDSARQFIQVDATWMLGT